VVPNTIYCYDREVRLRPSYGKATKFEDRCVRGIRKTAARSMEATTKQYIPAGLWESLQDVCYAHDVKFIEDAARIIGVPAAELRRKVFGVRGAPTAVIAVSGPWWSETACPIMINGPGDMWRRCGGQCEAHGTCWEHRNSHGAPRYDDAEILELPRRTPMRYEGMIVWVDTDGCGMLTNGTILKDVRFDVVNGVAHTTARVTSVGADGSADSRSFCEGDDGGARTPSD
jgi:hypothetical protein